MPLTDANREMFRQQFKEPIELLIAKKHTGFALMMITLPLLERLLRGRTQLKDARKLTEPFYTELFRIFPALKNVEGAKALWQSFRNGILHQATFSLKRSGSDVDFSGIIGFQELSGPAVALARSGTPGHEHIVCMVDPATFSKTVLVEVENDLETFQTAEPEKHPLAFFEAHAGGVYSIVIPLRGVPSS